MRTIRAPWRWEFWPYWLFYLPVYAQLALSALRNGSVSALTCANPGIPFGGLLEYSKYDLMRSLPAEFLPRTVVIGADVTLSHAAGELAQQRITFPIIAKPDRGERGFLVEKLHTMGELEHYLRRFSDFSHRLLSAGYSEVHERLLLQEYIEEPGEFGVMYVRRPADGGCRITSIVGKEFLDVTGDGEKTLSQLVRDGERTRLHESMLRVQFATEWDQVVPRHSDVQLVEIGNHIRGTTFLDANHLISDELTAHFDRLGSYLDGFYVGRFDVRCRDAEALRRGEFMVIEVNGVNSEPAHIYDPRNKLSAAYRDLLAHWREVIAIARENASAGCTPSTGRELFRAIRRHARRLKIARGAAE